MDELIRLTTTVTITTMPSLLLLLPRITVQTARDFLVIKLIRFFFLFVCSRARARIYSWHPGAIARTAYFDLDKSEEPLVGNTSTYDCADSRYVV